MSQLLRLCALTFLIGAVALGDALEAQSLEPVSLPKLKRSENVVVEALNKEGVKLPMGVVATIDGQDLTQADLLWHLLESNLGQISQSLLDAKLVELEMLREQITVTDEEVAAEIDIIIPRVAPGQTLEQVLSSGVYSKAYLEHVARTNVGRNKLFWKAKSIPEDKRGDQANQFLMQIWLGEIKNRYQISIRGQNPAPPKGALASLTTIIDGQKKAYTVMPEEALVFLTGVLRPAAIIQGLDDLVDAQLVRNELRKHEVRVSDSEIEGWVREMRAKYEGPFNWDMILRIQGLTPDKARSRWHDVQAWKRCNDITITEENLQKFRELHDDFFRSRHVKVRHVLIKSVDDITGLSAGREQEAAAKARAETVHRLANEGVDFQKLAQTYSDDTTTKGTGGLIGQPIKKWGGGYDPEFQRAAYALARGEISQPVKSSYGWHVIFCEEESPATTRDIDWANPRYADWVTEEYENHMADEWRKTLRSKAKITKASPEEVLRVKEAAFKAADR